MKSITGGTQNVTTYFAMRLSATGLAATGLTPTDFDLQYTRNGAVATAKVDATACASVGAVHADNTVIEVDATDQEGLYRVDWPDAAFAAGVPDVILTVKCATAFTEHKEISIDQPVSVTEWNGVKLATTNPLPNAAADAAGGLPVSDVGGLDLDALNTAAVRLTAARAGYIDNLNGHTAQTGDTFAQLPTNFGDLAINATTGEVSLTTAQADAIAVRVELALLAEGDGQAVLQGIADQIAADWVSGDASPVAVATAVWAAASRTLTANTNLNDISTAQVATELATYDGPTHDELVALFQLALRSDAAIATDRSADLTLINANEGTGAGDYDQSSEAQEALRDRGDAAWATGGGGALTQSLNVQTIIPSTIDLANTATVRIGMFLLNSLDDLPTTAEITPGTISIERKAIGGTSWLAVVTDSAMSEQAGMVYFDEVFDSGSGYAEGDSIRVTFKSVSITADTNTFEVCDANGLMSQTHIRQTMRGTNSAALASSLPTNFGDLAINATTGEVSLTTAQADAIAVRVELALLAEGDGQAVLQGIADQIAADWVSGDASPVAIATAVWAAATRSLTDKADFELLAATQASIDAIEVDTASLNDTKIPDTISLDAIADALLDRDMSVGTDSGSTTVRTPRQALRFLRNKWGVVGTTLSVYDETDGGTPSWTAEVSTDAAADPVTGSNPAGGS